MKTLIALLVLILSGCAGSVEKYRDSDYTIGCVVVEANTKLGYFNQEGAAEVCKAKCSDNLPDKFVYKYENVRTGCRIEIGSH